MAGVPPPLPGSVVSTADDAQNAFLAVYCRRLNPDTRIVSRINHERNLEAIHRAGADSVLSYGTLGVQSLLSLVRGRETVIIGEGVDIFVEPVRPTAERWIVYTLHLVAAGLLVVHSTFAFGGSSVISQEHISVSVAMNIARRISSPPGRTTSRSAPHWRP